MKWYDPTPRRNEYWTELKSALADMRRLANVASFDALPHSKHGPPRRPRMRWRTVGAKHGRKLTARERRTQRRALTKALRRKYDV